MKKLLTNQQYLISAAISGILVYILKLIWPSIIPFEMFQFWKFDFPLITVIIVSLPIILWMVGRNAYLAWRDTKSHETEDRAEGFLLRSTLASLWFGIMEELCFRWLIFYGLVIGAKMANLLACGTLSIVYSYVMGPIINVVTLGFLHDYLLGDLGWAVGFAIVVSNANFRDGHAYQGQFGMIQAWFGGMYFFYIMFNYGLVAAMLIHFLVDLCAFIVHYVDLVQGRNRRRKREARKA